MSTRCTITVRDEKNGTEAYSIYRHCDGYPDGESGVFATLPAALSYAWPLPRYEAMEFAAAIIVAWKEAAHLLHVASALPYTVQGGNIYMTKGRDQHYDTDYHYEVWSDGKGRIAVQCFRPVGEGDKREWRREGLVQYLTAEMQPQVRNRNKQLVEA
jgi:hypothetical protein